MFWFRSVAMGRLVVLVVVDGKLLKRESFLENSREKLITI